MRMECPLCHRTDTVKNVYPKRPEKRPPSGTYECRKCGMTFWGCPSCNVPIERFHSTRTVDPLKETYGTCPGCRKEFYMGYLG